MNPARQFNPFLRWPVRSLAVTLLLGAPLLLRLAGFEVSSKSRVLLEGDQRNLSSYETVRDILHGVELLVISMETGDVFSAAGIDAVRRVSEAFARRPGVLDVKSLTHSSVPVRRGFSFEMVPLVSEAPSAEELEQVRSFSLDHPLVRDVMVAGDSRHTILTVTYQRDLAAPEQQRALREEITATLAPFRDEGLRFKIIALPLIEDEIRTALRSDIGRFLPAALALMLAILWFTFRSMPVLLLVVLNQAITLALLPGVISAAGFTVNVFTVILFPLLAGIHLTLLIHVFTGWQQAQAAGAADPIGAMLDRVFQSCAFAAITTGVGLLSLGLSDVEPVREFGLMGATGIALVFFMTFGPGLALLTLSRRRAGIPASEERPPRGLEFSGLTQIVTRRAGWIFSIAAVAAVCAAAGMTRVRTDIRAVEFLDRRSPTRQAMEEFDRVYGGINVVQIEIDSGAANGANDPDFLKYVEEVQRYAETRPAVSGAYSYAQLLAMMNQIWEGNRPGALRLPDTLLKINLFVFALRQYDFPFLAALADPQFRTAYVVVRTPDMPSNEYLAVLRDIAEFAEKRRPPNVTVSAAKGLHSIIEADRRILRSQVQSAATTVGVIGLVLALLWRSVMLALISVVTNLIPVALVIAAAGYADVPLNSITIMVAAVAFGIAVDDSVHFITQWRKERGRGAAPLEALQHTFRVKALPIIVSSLILITIFSIFWLSSFPPVVHFGLLSAVAFAGALAAILFLLPALGRGFFK